METLKQVEKSLSQYPQSKLLAVSKTRSTSDILKLYDQGLRLFGENRVDELMEKAQALKDKDIQWHFIGNLQSNKLNKLLDVPGLKAIHSIDRLSLLEALIHRYQGKNLTSELSYYLQVNTSGETEKSGFSTLDELKQGIEIIEKKPSPSLTLAGLMTMGKIRTEDQLTDARICFQKLRKIRDELLENCPKSELKLSMGMSADYQIALEEGSDIIRVGSLLFS